MKIQIALAGNFGTNYADWQKRMENSKNFGEIKRLDDNKMVAVDTAGNTIESYTIDSDSNKESKTDTLDGTQSGAPADKTKQDVQVGDAKLDKEGV